MVIQMEVERNNIFKDFFKSMEEQTRMTWRVCGKIEA
jgi:hypothetical protein